jgi:hypothetical protein
VQFPHLTQEGAGLGLARREEDARSGGARSLAIMWGGLAPLDFLTPWDYMRNLTV